MALGICLLLIFILYLIDKHNRWRQAIKLTVTLIAFSILAIGGFFGWTKYDGYQTAKREEAEAAANAAAREARVKACLAKSTPAGNEIALAAEKEACERDPDAPLLIDWSKEIPLTPGATQSRGPVKSRLRRVQATFDTDIMTTEYGSLVCGHVAKDETVTLLAEDNVFVKVKTASGKVGWAGSGAFKVVE